MQVKIKQIDKNLPLPRYETKGSVGFDLICRQNVNIEPRCISLIPANIVVEVPTGYMLMLTLRSSTPKKYGLMMPHGVGIIDNDYCGEDDEIMIQVYNFTDETAIVNRGDRIAQGILVKVNVSIFQFTEIHEMSDESRGGFGSTNK